MKRFALIATVFACVAASAASQPTQIEAQYVVTTNGGITIGRASEVFSRKGDSYSIRRNALQMGVPYFTTISAGVAAVDAMEASAILPPGVVPGVRSIQEWHARSAERSKL